jgi:hypothetical protein
MSVSRYQFRHSNYETVTALLHVCSMCVAVTCDVCMMTQLQYHCGGILGKNKR